MPPGAAFVHGNRHKRARFLHRLAVLLVHVVGTNDDVSTVAGNVSVLGRCHRDDRVRDAVLLRVRIEVRHPGRDAVGAVPLVRRERQPPAQPPRAFDAGKSAPDNDNVSAGVVTGPTEGQPS